jgi:hypothetical protein
MNNLDDISGIAENTEHSAFRTSSCVIFPSVSACCTLHTNLIPALNVKKYTSFHMVTYLTEVKLSDVKMCQPSRPITVAARSKAWTVLTSFGWTKWQWGSFVLRVVLFFPSNSHSTKWSISLSSMDPAFLMFRKLPYQSLYLYNAYKSLNLAWMPNNYNIKLQ